MVAALRGTGYDTGLDLEAIQEVGMYFYEVRKKYHQFESDYTGVDPRVQVNQVPGGMISNLANQLREQNALDRMNEVLLEIPVVRKDLGFPPLVTPTSQIVGTQAVLNVLSGERYKNLSKETIGILKGEYGASPAALNQELQKRVLDAGKSPITCRPADLLEPEVERLTEEFRGLASDKGVKVAEHEIDDVLTYALFPQVGLKFLINRNNPDAFEPVPGIEPAAPKPAPAAAAAPVPVSGGPESYTVSVNGKSFDVVVAPGGAIQNVAPAAPAPAAAAAQPQPITGEPLPAPLAGTIFKIKVTEGQTISEGDVVVIMEAMKMETEIRAAKSGVVLSISVKEGDAVQVGSALLVLG